MEKIKAKCTQIVQAENRGTVMFSVIGKEKKVEKQFAYSCSDPKEASKFEHGKEYSITIDLVK